MVQWSIVRAVAIVVSIISSAASADTTVAQRQLLDSAIVGALAHDVGERTVEGIDPNLELRLALPLTLFDEIRVLPTVGGTLNFNDGANTAYVGGTLQYRLENGLFVEGFLGIAGHTAKTPVDAEDSNLGCRVLFREAAELGYQWQSHRIGVMIAHYSNGGVLCSAHDNQGLTQLGVRYGVNF